MTMRILAAATAAAMLLTACAVQHQPVLDAYQLQCQSGDQNACRQVPGLTEVVEQEKSVRDDKIAKGVFLVLLAVLTAGAVVASARSAPPPPPVIVPPPPPFPPPLWRP